MYNGPPKPLNKTGADLLKKWCPHMDPSQVCCDAVQVQTMDQSIGLAANFLKRFVIVFFHFVGLFKITLSELQVSELYGQSGQYNLPDDLFAYTVHLP